MKTAAPTAAPPAVPPADRRPRGGRLLRALMVAAALTAPAALAACSPGDALQLRHQQPVPGKLQRAMKRMDMPAESPVLMRIFKEEAKLEVWKKTRAGRYAKLVDYDICAYSGELGPKQREGDRQAPEGFYHVSKGLMNPNSSYFLSFNLGFPNSFDRAHGRTGSHLMVHGACSSRGCYAMEDEQISEIYALARDALKGGQSSFQVQALPFRMTPENMARHRANPNFAFWENLKKGYDYFELTGQQPVVEVCDRSYRFNERAVSGSFLPSAACPETSTPRALAKLYADYQSKYQLQFDKAVRKLGGEPKAPSVADANDGAIADVNVPDGVEVSPLAGK